MVRPGIKDVARAAGVSMTTVSLVLNGKDGGRISDSTRRRVHDVVASLGYAPNSLAQGLRAQRSQTIGFLSDRITTTPFAVSMVQAAQEAAWRRGYLLFLLDTGGDREIEAAAVAQLHQQQVAGIVYASMFHQVVPAPGGLPDDAVFLDARPEGGGFRSVVPDDRGGARAATFELLDQGHRRIAFVDDERAPVASELRLLGYQDALSERGVPFDPALHVTGGSAASGGLAAAGELLDRPPDERPTGIFCFNDRMAMGAYRAARHRGPRDRPRCVDRRIRRPADTSPRTWIHHSRPSPFLTGRWGPGRSRRSSTGRSRTRRGRPRRC